MITNIILGAIGFFIVTLIIVIFLDRLETYMRVRKNEAYRVIFADGQSRPTDHETACVLAKNYNGTVVKVKRNELALK